MRDGRLAVVTKATPAGDDDRVLFVDDGSEKRVTAWDIDEILEPKEA
jgi:hypothetical protein